jgi:hypothetical protein
VWRQQPLNLKDLLVLPDATKARLDAGCALKAHACRERKVLHALFAGRPAALWAGCRSRSCIADITERHMI